MGLRSLSPLLVAAATGVALLACSPETEAPAEDPTKPSTDGPTRREDFAAWRAAARPTPPKIGHGFLTGRWRMTDGPMHYFVSELVEVEMTAQESTPQAAAAATQLATEFRARVTELVAGWGDRPTVAPGFTERHFFTDRDAAELQRLRFLSRRKGPNVEIHRLWVR